MRQTYLTSDNPTLTSSPRFEAGGFLLSFFAVGEVLVSKRLLRIRM